MRTKQVFLFLVLIFNTFIFAKPFDPIHYTPNIKLIDIDADKCPVQLFVAANDAGVPGADSIVALLKKRFEGQGGAGTEPTDPTS